jgi:hypothetical protein
VRQCINSSSLVAQHELANAFWLAPTQTARRLQWSSVGRLKAQLEAPLRGYQLGNASIFTSMEGRLPWKNTAANVFIGVGITGPVNSRFQSPPLKVSKLRALHVLSDSN